MATLFEGGLLILALMSGWVFSINPLEHWRLEGVGLTVALLGVLPLYVPLTRVLNRPCELAWVNEIKQLMIQMLGDCLRQCRRRELLYVAGLAGVAEEVFFRGLLQAGLEQEFGLPSALLFSNLLFAAVHWVTPGYALLAGGAGLYLGISLYFTGEPNLLIPVVIHAVYDYLALQGFSKVCPTARTS